jgi:hypothetical protein
MSMLCNCCVRELLILARTWFAFGLPSKTGCDNWFFGEKILLDPANIIFLCCFWLDSWAIRQREKEKEIVVQGSRLIER